MRNSRRVHSVASILPPYLLRSIAENGSQEQRVAALRTLAVDTTFRSLRAMSGAGAEAYRRKLSSFAADGEKQRTIYSAENTRTLPGKVVRAEGDPPTDDAAADEAYAGLGATYDFYWEILGRSSIDDDGLALNATVHFGDRYNNAFWDGQRMVFGDGDGQLFNRFTISLDVIGHELTHGVTEDEAQLVYMSQSGALNESMSDVMGSLIKQRVLKQTAGEADWLIGQGLLTSKVNGVALRSMQEPGTAYDDPVLGKDPQPAHMKDFVNTFEDNGGVHINSGIPNRAFAIAATNIGGYAWERAGRIWYLTLRDPQLRPNTAFRRFARITVECASRLFGQQSIEELAVRDAWDIVGVEPA